MNLRISHLTIGVALSLTLSACHHADDTAAVVRPAVTMTVQAGAVTELPGAPGEIAPRFHSQLSFRVGGKIIERKVALGDGVKVGQVLAILDPADLRSNVAIAKQQLDIAQQRYALANSQAERDRLQIKENLIPQAQAEQSETNVDNALAQFEQAKQQYELAQNQFRYGSLVADHNGVISAELANTGDNVAPGQPVFDVAWSGEVDVVANVGEATLAMIKVGTPATVILPTLPGKELAATVREIAPQADPNSRSFKVKLTLKESNTARLGSTAQVWFNPSSSTSRSDVIRIPSTALFHENQQPAVWIVQKDDSLVLRRVEVARYTANQVYVANGLTNGERIVMQGVHTVSAGLKVRPINPVDAKPAAAFNEFDGDQS